jgi:AcrR family transcriptional regulator
MDDVAEEAGVSKGTLYLYFDSKDSIILGILKSFLGRELDQARKLLEEKTTETEKLQALTRIVVADFKRMQPLMPLYFEFIALSMRRKTVRKAIQSFFQAYMDMLEPLIRQGIESGEFRDVDAHDAALAIGAIFEGTILLWVYSPDTVNLETTTISGIELLLQGLKAKGE